METSGSSGSALQSRLLVAALVVVSTVAVMASVGLADWSTQGHEAFREEVLAVLAQRFHKVAKPVLGDVDSIEIDGHRRDLRKLFAVATCKQEPERGAAIYQWFLGDTATVGRGIVRDKPFENSPEAPSPLGAGFPPPKRVKALRFGPDGSVLR